MSVKRVLECPASWGPLRKYMDVANALGAILHALHKASFRVS